MRHFVRQNGQKHGKPAARGSRNPAHAKALRGRLGRHPARGRPVGHTSIETITKGQPRQGQLESGEYAGLEDLAKAVGLPRLSRKVKTGCDHTYVGRMLGLTSLAQDRIEAILSGDEALRSFSEEEQTPRFTPSSVEGPQLGEPA